MHKARKKLFLPPSPHDNEHSLEQHILLSYYAYTHKYTLFRHGKNISYKNGLKHNKKSDLHVCRVGARGRHQEIDKTFKVAKRSSSSSIVAIPQLCPTVTETLF